MPKTLNVRPRSQRTKEDDSTDEPYSDELEGSSPSLLVDGYDVETSDDEQPSRGDDVDMHEDGLSDSQDSQDDLSDASTPDVDMQLSKVSFGDLAKAQSKMSRDPGNSRKRQRGADTSADTEAKLQALRDRLRELREAKGIVDAHKDADRPKSSITTTQDSSASDSESASDGPDEQPSKRSKHAPSALSSSKAVSRKRTVVSSSKTAAQRARDPRFTRVSGPAASRDQLSKNYAFLQDYRQSEITALKDKLGVTPKGRRNKMPQQRKKEEKLSEEEKARLKKELSRMESQEQARQERQRIEDVAKKHKQAEREMVAEGKNPYFLKRSEQKRRALVDKFEGMKSKQKDKALDRRRKKIAAREKRNMPAARRGVVE